MKGKQMQARAPSAWPTKHRAELWDHPTGEDQESSPGSFVSRDIMASSGFFHSFALLYLIDLMDHTAL